MQALPARAPRGVQPGARASPQRYRGQRLGAARGQERTDEVQRPRRQLQRVQLELPQRAPCRGVDLGLRGAQASRHRSPAPPGSLRARLLRVKLEDALSHRNPSQSCQLPGMATRAARAQEGCPAVQQSRKLASTVEQHARSWAPASPGAKASACASTARALERRRRPAARRAARESSSASARGEQPSGVQVQSLAPLCSYLRRPCGARQRACSQAAAGPPFTPPSPQTMPLY